MKRFLANNRGLTLVEIVVTIAILAIIIAPISSMFITTAKTNNVANEKMRATVAAQKAMENIKSVSDINLIESNQVIDNFQVKIDKEAIYNFADIKSEFGADDNTYDLKIEFNDRNEFVLYDRLGNSYQYNGRIMTIEYKSNRIEVKLGEDTFDAEIKETPDVRIEFYGDGDDNDNGIKDEDEKIFINVTNKETQTLDIYVMKSKDRMHDDKPDYTFNNLGGSINFYNNILINKDAENLEPTRVYKVYIQVFNDNGDLVEELTGYKTFLQ